MRTGALAFALVVAGCISQPTDVPAPSASALDLPWELVECRYFIADVPADAAALAARLPEGFELDPNPSPLSPVAGSEPYLGIEAFSCADGSVWASTYTPVIAPDGLDVPDHLIFVMWDTLVDNESRRAELAARGFPARAGSVTITGLLGPTPTSEARFELEGIGPIVMQAAQPRPGSPFEGDFVEYMEAEDGALAAWTTHYAATTVLGGSAIVEVPADSWIADVIGGPRAQAPMITGTWSFTNGSVRVPP